MAKWTLIEKEPFGGGSMQTRVFRVRQKDWPDWQGVDVWWNGFRLACTQCQGSARAMLSGCAHCKTVKSHLINANDWNPRG